MVLGHNPDENHAQKRPSRQIEDMVRELRYTPAQVINRCAIHCDELDRYLEFIRDGLDRLSPARADGRAQGFMASHEAIDGPLQERSVERPAQAQR
jgi:hypothetical protein